MRGVPESVETVSFEWAVPPADRVTVVALKLVVGPEGADAAERVTGPAKLLMLDTVMVELAFEPWIIVREEGLDETPKSGVGCCTTKLPIIAVVCMEQ